MILILEGFGKFMVYCFEILVVSMIWNAVFRAFTGGRL